MGESRSLDRAAAARFARYGEYKDSGVEWLGEIPAHWDVRRLGRIGRVTKCSGGSKADDSSEGEPCVRYGDLYSHFASFVTSPRAFVARERAARYSSARYGDLLFAASGETIEEIGRAAVNLTSDVLRCGGDIIRIRPTPPASARFLGYLVNSPYLAYQKSRVGRGMTVMHIYGSQLKTLLVLVPPLPEQRAIADFLDRETAKIDALVVKQEELIGVLKEKRTALISHAVTKGLDADAAMKDSSVEWLGEIPAHWEVQALKTLSAMRSGDSITSDSIESTGPYPVFGGNGLRGYTGDFTHEGDHVLIGRQGAHCGNVHLARGRFWASEHAVVVTLKGPNLVEWCGALLEAMDLNRLSVAAAQPGLAVERLRDSQVAVPPVVEQREIVGFLDRETATIAELVIKANEAITLLNEYRTALISAAVTGQIDVRQQVADPPEPIDYGLLSAKRTIH